MSNKGGQGGRSLQDIMSGDLFAQSSRGEIVETLKFIEKHGTPVSERQVAAVALLKSLQVRRDSKVYDPIIKVMTSMAKDITPPKVFTEVVEKMTLGGFVQGKVRMNKIFGGDR